MAFNVRFVEGEGGYMGKNVGKDHHYDVEITHSSGQKKRYSVKHIRIISGPNWPLSKSKFVKDMRDVKVSEDAISTAANNLQFGVYIVVLRRLLKPYAYFDTYFKKLWVVIIASIIELFLKNYFQRKRITIKKKKIESITFENLIEAAVKENVVNKSLGVELHKLRRARNRVHIGTELDLAWPKDKGMAVALKAHSLLKKVMDGMKE